MGGASGQMYTQSEERRLCELVEEVQRQRFPKLRLFNRSLLEMMRDVFAAEREFILRLYKTQELYSFSDDELTLAEVLLCAERRGWQHALARNPEQFDSFIDKYRTAFFSAQEKRYQSILEEEKSRRRGSCDSAALFGRTRKDKIDAALFAHDRADVKKPHVVKFSPLYHFSTQRKEAYVFTIENRAADEPQDEICSPNFYLLRENQKETVVAGYSMFYRESTDRRQLHTFFSM